MPRIPGAIAIIDGKTVQKLVQAQGIQSATILGQAGGWAVLVRHGAAEHAVAAQRARQPRLWRNLNTVAAYVCDELGLPRFDVDSAAYDPAAIVRTRPDQAERLRRQHEAVAHDTWFRARVQEALDGIASGTNPPVPDAVYRDLHRGRDGRVAPYSAWRAAMAD